MTQSTSSAEPVELALYSSRALAMDLQLAAGAHPLRGALQHFEATCREPAFRLTVSHVADWMGSHARAAEVVERRVGEVGINFFEADIENVFYQILGGLNWYPFPLQLLLFMSDVWPGPMPDVWQGAERAISNSTDTYLQFHAQMLYWRETATMLLSDLQSVLARANIFAASVTSIALRPRIPTIEPVAKGNNVKIPQNQAELFQEIENLSPETPIRVIQIGPDEYLVLVQGTHGWLSGSQVGFTNFYTGLGFYSVYSERVREVVESQIPAGATVHLAGHSQGGHVVQLVGNHLAESGRYVVGSVTGFGAYKNTVASPKIRSSSVYVFQNDAIRLIDKVNEAEVVLSDATTENMFDAHGDYEHSQQLQNTPVPFHAPPDWSPEYFDFDAPDLPPVTDALISGVTWTNKGIATATEVASDGIEDAVTVVQKARDKGKDAAAIYDAARRILESTTQRDFSPSHL